MLYVSNAGVQKSTKRNLPSAQTTWKNRNPDVAIDGPLPSELEEALMQFLCVTNEISWSEYRSVIEAEGFVRVKVSDESVSLRELLETIKKRLLVAELLTAVGKLPIRRDQLERGKRLVTHAKAAVDRGSLRYAMITAQKPNA